MSKFFNSIQSKIYFLHPFSWYLYLVKKGVPSLYWPLRAKWLEDLKIDTVLDIGANIGRTASTFRYLFPNATIHCFEPIPACYDELLRTVAGDNNCLNYNIALGATESTSEINVNSHLPSSSLLALGESHQTAFPFAQEASKINIEIKVLDQFKPTKAFGKSTFIKIDVQGFELEVIKGGAETFKSAKVVLVEMSYDELYSKQPLFDDIYAVLTELGFKYYGSVGTATNPQNGLNIQADCIFLNQNKSV